MHAINDLVHPRASEFPWPATAMAPQIFRAYCYDALVSRLGTGSMRLGQSDASDDPTHLTVDQLQAARSGDRRAMNALFERLAPPLQRFARGRLPGWARGMVSTVDIVQETLVSTFLALEADRPADDLGIHAYLRTALKNRLIDHLRKVERRPELAEMDRTHEGATASPLEQAIGAEALDRYERALDSLSETDREAVVARVELGLSYNDIAGLLGKPSADAARMTVSRALMKVAEAMNDE